MKNKCNPLIAYIQSRLAYRPRPRDITDASLGEHCRLVTGGTMATHHRRSSAGTSPAEHYRRITGGTLPTHYWRDNGDASAVGHCRRINRAHFSSFGIGIGVGIGNLDRRGTLRWISFSLTYVEKRRESLL